MSQDMSTKYRCKKQVTRLMAGINHTLAILMSMLRVSLEYAWKQPRVCLEAAWSMARDCNATLRPLVREWLEYAYSMPTVCLETKNLFPYGEQNIPTLGTKHSQPGNKTGFLRPFSSKRAELERRLAVSMLLMLTLGSGSVWGQSGTDRSGIYYFVNCGSGKDGDPKMADITNPDDYFYLVPADNPQQDNKRDAWFSNDYSTANGDSEKPYLTTYKTKKDAADVPEGVTNRPQVSLTVHTTLYGL